MQEILDNFVMGYICLTVILANMYHILPHDYKMGLYWSPGHVHDRHIYYDDFKMTTERVGYFPPVIETDSSKIKKKQ